MQDSVLVLWTSNGRVNLGWEEYSFITLAPEQAGVTVIYENE